MGIGYDQIPGMPEPAVAGHAGRLVIGANPLHDVLIMQGRIHAYEGHALSQITFATQLLHALGVRQLILTNAAGGIRHGFMPGDLMILDGHWTFLNVAEPSDSSTRLSQDGYVNLWSPRLRNLALTTPTSLNVHQGVYSMMSGPNYETPAEVRMLQTFGVDAVGMSTVPEALAAARRGIEVLGVSCITNVASGLSDQPLDHNDVSETAASVENRFTQWILDVVAQLD